jgi:hypothetical protein
MSKATTFLYKVKRIIKKHSNLYVVNSASTNSFYISGQRFSDHSKKSIYGKVSAYTREEVRDNAINSINILLDAEELDVNTAMMLKGLIHAKFEAHTVQINKLAIARIEREARYRNNCKILKDHVVASDFQGLCKWEKLQHLRNLGKALNLPSYKYLLSYLIKHVEGKTRYVFLT